MSLVTLSVLPMIALAVLGYRLLEVNRHARSASPQNRRASSSVRAIELTVIAILTGILCLFIATNGVGPLIPIRSFALIRGTMMSAVLIVTACAGILAVVWKLSISRIAFALAGLLLTGSFVFASTKPLSYEKYVDEIRQIPVPVVITTTPPIANIEVIMNGVSMGQTPLTTTIDDIINKTPSREGTKPAHSEAVTIREQSYFEQKRLPLQRATDIINYNNRDKPLELDFQFKRYGKPVLISGNMSWQNGSRMHGQISPAIISFGVMTEEWDRDTTLLLTKARLANYRIDHEWVAAAETFAGFVRPAIVNAIQTEPGFQQVLNDWAADHYHLDQLTNSETAWDAFQSICREADHLRSYGTNSMAGDAIEQLVDKLNVEQVIAAAENRLALLEKTGAREIGWSWHSQNGQESFSYYPPNAGSLLASDFVLAHVIWKLDAKLSKSNQSHDNDLQRRLGPPLLRMSYAQPMIKSLTDALGGSSIDEFHRRLQRGVHGYDPSSDPTKNQYINGLEKVLTNFWTLVNLNDRVGAKFRRDQSSSAVELAKKQLAHSQGMMSIPSWMDYLFLDVEGREPLARDVWKSFEGACVSDPASYGHLLNLKWNYLARIRPTPDVAEFISVIQKTDVEKEPFFNPDTALAPLPDNLKFEIATRTLPILRKSEEGRDPNSIPFVMTQTTINRIAQLISTIPSDEAAEFFVSMLDPSRPDAKHHREYFSWIVQSQCAAAKMTTPLLKVLSRSDDARLRRIVLPQLELMPTIQNREILQGLQNDDDPEVRSAADIVAERINDLQRSELPLWVD